MWSGGRKGQSRGEGMHKGGKGNACRSDNIKARGHMVTKAGVRETRGGKARYRRGEETDWSKTKANPPVGMYSVVIKGRSGGAHVK